MALDEPTAITLQHGGLRAEPFRRLRQQGARPLCRRGRPGRELLATLPILEQNAPLAQHQRDGDRLRADATHRLYRPHLHSLGQGVIQMDHMRSPGQHHRPGPQILPPGPDSQLIALQFDGLDLGVGLHADAGMSQQRLCQRDGIKSQVVRGSQADQHIQLRGILQPYRETRLRQQRSRLLQLLSRRPRAHRT